MYNNNLPNTQGNQAFWNGEPLSANPYTPRDYQLNDNYKKWQQGWEEGRQKAEWDSEVPYNEHHNIHAHINSFEYFSDIS